MSTVEYSCKDFKKQRLHSYISTRTKSIANSSTISWL